VNVEAIDQVRAWGQFGVQVTILFALLRFGGPIATSISTYLIERRRIAAQEKVSDREGWGQLIDELREEVSKLRQENGELRKEVRELHGILDGMRRQQLSATLETQRAMIAETDASPAMRRALGTLRDVSRETQE
jgi:uncharacterized protein YlxW (UPF0749 family)